MDYRCPLCTEDELTPGVKLMFSICGHHTCERCMKTLFRTDTQISCPICRKLLRRSDFSSKYLEDREVEKDKEVRKNVLSIFNKLEDNFLSKSEYYDYLEKIEDIIENILTQNNIEETKSFIDAEKENNKLEIIKNEGRIKDSLKEQYEKAVVEDSLYNENLREEAARISTNRVEDIQETIIIKHMPECKNIDTDYNLKNMENEIRLLFLHTSGYDVYEIHNTGISELIDGLT